MCHQLLCCFGTKEPDNRPPSRRQEQGPPSSPTKVSSSVNGGSSPHVSSDINRSPPSSSHHKVSSAINGGARSPDQQSNTPTSQGDRQEVISQDQNTKQALNGKIQDKPSPYSTQGKVNPKEQATNNPKEQETRSEKPADLNEEQQLASRVPPKNSGTRDQTADQDKVSHKVLTPYNKEFVQDEEASRKPLPPKQQVHPPKGSSTNQETDDQKVSTKIVAPKRINKEYDPSEDESRKHADK